MRSHVSSPLNLAAQSFRVLRALNEVIREQPIRVGDAMLALMVTERLLTHRPRVLPIYTEEVVQNELNRLIRDRLVGAPKLRLTKDGLEILNAGLANNDPLLERYRQWYSPEKQMVPEEVTFE